MSDVENKYLYRLLRDDEELSKDGIIGKNLTRIKEPEYHIRRCSKSAGCQWISTCASEIGLQKMIELKKKKLDKEKKEKGKNEKKSVLVRWVVIDRRKLEEHASKCTSEEDTGRILDFTKSEIMDEYLPKLEDDKTFQIQRRFASCYEEVLVERCIPRHCCKEICSGDSLYTVASDLKDALP